MIEMFENNAKLFWTFRNKLQPDEIEFLGAFPEDTPINYVYKLTKDDFHSYVAVQMSNSGLMTREINDQDELNFLLEQNASDNKQEPKSEKQ